MAKNVIDLEFEIDQQSINRLGKQIKDTIEKAAVITTERLVKRAEDATLITQYTQSSKPAKPAGSAYIRTFRLQFSSERSLISDSFPIEARWEAKTEYASLVIGEAKEQAAIHSGRWPALELAINNVKQAAQGELDKAIQEVRK